MAKSKFVPYRVFVCFGDVDRSVPWDRLGYIARQERAAAYARAGIRQSLCAKCSRYVWPEEAHNHETLEART